MSHMSENWLNEKWTLNIMTKFARPESSALWDKKVIETGVRGGQPLRLGSMAADNLAETRPKRYIGSNGGPPGKGEGRSLKTVFYSSAVFVV